MRRSGVVGAALEGREGGEAREAADADQERLGRAPSRRCSAWVIAKTIAPRLVVASSGAAEVEPAPARLRECRRGTIFSAAIASAAATGRLT